MFIGDPRFADNSRLPVRPIVLRSRRRIARIGIFADAALVSRRALSLGVVSARLSGVVLLIPLSVGRAHGAGLVVTLAFGGLRAGAGFRRHRLSSLGRGPLIVLRVFLRRGDNAGRYDRDGRSGRKQFCFHSGFLR